MSISTDKVTTTTVKCLLMKNGRGSSNIKSLWIFGEYLYIVFHKQPASIYVYSVPQQVLVDLVQESTWNARGFSIGRYFHSDIVPNATSVIKLEAF